MKRNYKPLKTISALAVMLSLLLSSCSESNADANNKSATTSTPIKQEIATRPLSQMQPEYTLTVSGELEPSEQVALYARVNGFVKKLHVEIGAPVKKGQLLAVLEAPEMDQLLVSDQSSEQKLQSDYLYAQQNLERLKEAAKTEGAVAAIELERAQSVLNSAKAAYESSRAQTGHSAQMQKYLHVVAPFKGVITQRNVSEGALVGPGSGQPIFTIADEENLKLKIALPEKHSGSVNDTMVVSFTVNSQPGKEFTAKLSRSSKLINSQNRAMTLEFDVNNIERRLNGGEYAQVQLRLKRQTPTFFVSPKNILNTQSGLFVLLKHMDNIERIPVKEGIRLDTLTEVFGNLKSGDKIVQRPTEQMK